MVHGDELTTAQALDWALPRVRRDGWRLRTPLVCRARAAPGRRSDPQGSAAWRVVVQAGDGLRLDGPR